MTRAAFRAICVLDHSPHHGLSTDRSLFMFHVAHLNYQFLNLMEITLYLQLWHKIPLKIPGASTGTKGKAMTKDLLHANFLPGNCL